jgi:hypothetical protein
VVPSCCDRPGGAQLYRAFTVEPDVGRGSRCEFGGGGGALLRWYQPGSNLLIRIYVGFSSGTAGSWVVVVEGSEGHKICWREGEGGREF